VYKDFKGLHPRLSSETSFVQTYLSLKAPLNFSAPLWGENKLAVRSWRPSHSQLQGWALKGQLQGHLLLLPMG